MNKDELKHFLALSFIPNIGPVLSKNLISYCGSVSGIFEASKGKLEKVPGIGKILAEIIINNKSFDRAEKELEFIDKNEIKAIGFFDEDYPQRYKKCEDSPILLFTKGNMNLNIPKVISVVGTRKITSYGKDICTEFIKGLSETGALIVSGMAYGIDIYAHTQAVKINLQTIGVLAHGLDRLYPSIHKPTANKMIENGGLLTEYPSGTNPDRENFVKRNRIIAGLADAVIIIEADERSGSLITATFASNYNRDVFAFPGRITDKFSKGCNFIIKANLATLIESAQDLIFNMGWDEDGKNTKPVQSRILFTELTDEQKVLYDILNKCDNGLDIDNITIQANIPGSTVSVILLQMEFDGILKSLPGKMYQLV
jgi:DNA processing protein